MDLATTIVIMRTTIRTASTSIPVSTAVRVSALCCERLCAMTESTRPCSTLRMSDRVAVMSSFQVVATLADRGEPAGRSTARLPPLPPLSIACASMAWAASTGGPATVLL